MNIQLASDLHCEVHRDGGRSFVDSMDASGVDVLVLAGDICKARIRDPLLDLFGRWSSKYPCILYVPGNHELWDSRASEAMNLIKTTLVPYKNVHVMDNSILELGGRRFLGGPMWFGQWGDIDVADYPDFERIKGLSPWVIVENLKFKTFIRENLQKDDIVLTHYLPSMQSVPLKYRRSTSNAFFVCDMEELIKQRKPKLWLHGHTHGSCDYVLGNTRVVANPLGLPKEPSTYNEKLVITL